MRKLFILTLVVLFAVSCGSRQNQTQSTEETLQVMTVDELMVAAADHVDQEVVISGLITHVCKHGGQRCFVMGSTDAVTIRVEAGDEIGSFKQEYVGSELQITGILRLVPVDGGHECSEGEVATHEHEKGTEMVEEGVVKTETEVAEEYVPSYFIEGVRYSVVSEPTVKESGE